jgi:hypothetical protein
MSIQVEVIVYLAIGGPWLTFLGVCSLDVGIVVVGNNTLPVDTDNICESK